MTEQLYEAIKNGEGYTFIRENFYKIDSSIIQDLLLYYVCIADNEWVLKQMEE